MLILLSPAKKQNFDPINLNVSTSLPSQSQEIKVLSAELKNYSPTQLKQLMGVSDNLAKLNADRFADFSMKKFKEPYAKPAVFAFQGDAYQKLAVNDFSETQLEFLQNHLVILSGLYGYLRPLDLIQPYRLEMKTPLATKNAQNLYELWRTPLVKALNERLSLEKKPTVLNLASGEYSKAIDLSQLNAEFITVEFKELKAGKYKSIGINAKRARGLMVRYIAKKGIKTLNPILKFNEEGYYYSAENSKNNRLVFLRD